MDPSKYTNHTGGARGADITWDRIGRRYGVIHHVHWRPSDLETLPEGMIEKAHAAVESAAKALGRPSQFKGIELVQRNWLQVHYSEAIYAVSYIVQPGNKDFKGFINDTGKEVVSGGTGWAVEMAIQAGKPVYVFDMGTDQWYSWDPINARFALWAGVPELTENFAGIGSRHLTPSGVAAIENAYKKTFNYEKV